LSFLSDQELIYAAVRSSATAFVCEDLQGVVRTWNTGAEQLYGYCASEAVGRSMDSLFSLPSVFRAQALSGEGETSQEVSRFHKDGHEVKVWLQVRAIKNESGQVVGCSEVSKLLPKAEGPDGLPFEQFFEAAPNAMLIVDDEGRLERVNSQAETLFGYDREDLVGMVVEALVPERYRKHHPSYRELFFDAPQSRPMGGGRDLFALHRSGREFPVEIGLKPLDTLGRRYVLISVVDITTRKIAEQRFKLAVEAAPSAMLMVDSSGLINLVNSQTEKLFGYAREQLLGEPVERLIPARLGNGHRKLRQDYLSAPSTRAMGAGRELFGLRSDGSEVPVEIGLNPITTLEGDFVLASIIDISERRKATEELKASLRDKDVLLQEIHHRVKNNLAVVVSLLYLQSTRTEDERLLQILQDCQERVRSMALVHERLYTTGDLARLNFAEYIRELTEQLAHNHSVEGRVVTLDFQLEALTLDLKQAVPCGLVVNELVSNAFKHAFTGRTRGVVSLALNRAGEGLVELTVSDDGWGLDLSELEETDSLGLRLVRSLIRQIDGELEIAGLPQGGCRAKVVLRS
jgi:PAS domain S-box-containing protein